MQQTRLTLTDINAKYRIERWLGRVAESEGTIQREDVCFLMVQIRHLIETSKANENYRVAAFYADWTVHTALDRSIVCFEVLRDVTRAISENFSTTKPNFTNEVSSLIGFPQLRTELIALFHENGLPTTIFEKAENWNIFFNYLLWHVAGQPIAFPATPTGRAKAIRDEMLANSRPHNVTVEKLAIVDFQGSPHWCLEISGDRKLRMMGAVDVGTPTP